MIKLNSELRELWHDTTPECAIFVTLLEIKRILEEISEKINKVKK